MNETEKLNIISNRYRKKLNEGINIELIKNARLISITDDHENGIDTSVKNNPVKKVFKMNDGYNLTVYSIFKRNRLAKHDSDGNPLIYAIKGEKNYKFATPYFEKLFWTRFDMILDKFLSSYKDSVIVSDLHNIFKHANITVPSSKNINKIIAHKIKEKSSNCIIIDDLIEKLSPMDIYLNATDKNSYFYKFWKRQNRYEEMIEELDLELEKMNGLFKLHSISNMSLRMSLRDFLRLNPNVIDNYRSEINDNNILIIDDTITYGRSLRCAYSAIVDSYFPKSITALTMFSESVK